MWTVTLTTRKGIEENKTATLEANDESNQSTGQLGEQGVQFDTQELPISNNTITPEPYLEACYKTHQQLKSPILTNQIKKRNRFQNCSL